MDRDDASPIAMKAHDMAQQALARVTTLERLIEERRVTEERRHEETRNLIIDLKGSFRENFLALQSRVAESADDIRKALTEHKEEDDRRFGVIGSRSWAAMWALNGVLVTMLLGLAAAVWKLSIH